MKHVPRIHVSGDLSEGARLSLSAEALHHLINVMRVENGAEIRVFNADFGEWLAECEIQKKTIFATCVRLEKPPKISSYFREFCMCFPAIAPQRTHMILEKCTELGVTKFCPIITEYTQRPEINIEKANRIIISAVEQCGRLDVPEIERPMKLANLLNQLSQNPNNFIIVADIEGKDFSSFAVDLRSQINDKNVFVIVGPEGGFSNNELANLKKIAEMAKFNNNILRTETACIMITGVVMSTMLST